MGKYDFCFGFGPRWQGVWPPGTVERNRKLYDFELVYFASGRSRVLTRDAEFDCRAGAVLIVPPGITHCTIGDTRVCRWCVHFDWFDDTPAHRLAEQVFVFDADGDDFIPEWTARTPDGVPMPFFNPRTPPALLLSLSFLNFSQLLRTEPYRERSERQYRQSLRARRSFMSTTVKRDLRSSEIISCLILSRQSILRSITQTRRLTVKCQTSFALTRSELCQTLTRLTQCNPDNLISSISLVL